jgi:hypothetical protein
MQISKVTSCEWFSISIGADYFYKLYITIIFFKHGVSFNFFVRKHK